MSGSGVGVSVVGVGSGSRKWIWGLSKKWGCVLYIDFLRGWFFNKEG